MTGASQANGLGSAKAPEPQSRLGPAGAIPSAGDVFTIAYPFVRDTFEEFGCNPVPTWRPGIRYEAVGPEDAGAVADALGGATFVVEGAYKPGRFPARVFFTRKFTTPDGRVFGKTKLHIATLEKFRRLTKGYQHPFGIGEPLERRHGHRSARAIFEQMLAEHAASVGRNAERQDHEDGLGPKDEHAVGSVADETPDV